LPVIILAIGRLVERVQDRFADLIRADQRKWEKVVKDADIKVE